MIIQRMLAPLLFSFRRCAGTMRLRGGAADVLCNCYSCQCTFKRSIEVFCKQYVARECQIVLENRTDGHTGSPSKFGTAYTVYSLQCYSATLPTQLSSSTMQQQKKT